MSRLRLTRQKSPVILLMLKMSQKLQIIRNPMQVGSKKPNLLCLKLLERNTLMGNGLALSMACTCLSLGR